MDVGVCRVEEFICVDSGLSSGKKRAPVRLLLKIEALVASASAVKLLTAEMLSTDRLSDPYESACRASLSARKAPKTVTISNPSIHTESPTRY